MDEFSDGRLIFAGNEPPSRREKVALLLALVVLGAAGGYFLHTEGQKTREEASYDKRCRQMNGVPWREDGARLCYQTYGFIHIVGGERAGFDRGAK